jgi:hypothetical protein
MCAALRAGFAVGGEVAVDLSGEWRLTGTDAAGKPMTCPAQVPGDVHSALLAAGKIPDPFFGANETNVQWVGERDWTFSLDFTPPPEVLSAPSAILRLEDVDTFAREVGETYTDILPQYTNCRGGIFQAGLYPVSANVPLGYQTGATPDGRLSNTPIADGVGPASGRDVLGPTATANSVSRLNHAAASNGTLFNQKFHPSALSSMASLEKFVAYLRGYFDQKGMHVQYNVVSRETLLDAQKNPEKYKNLVVRVAGYSALFTTLSRSLQDDIIARTEQGW